MSSKNLPRVNSYYASYIIDLKDHVLNDPNFNEARNYYDTDKERLINQVSIIVKHKLKMLPFQTSAEIEVKDRDHNVLDNVYVSSMDAMMDKTLEEN